MVQESDMAIFCTAGTHLGHANIIQHCRRPFASVVAMDAAIIDRINSRVGPDDWLYHPGDFSFRGGDPAAYRARIRCRNMVLILGNHDPCFADCKARPEFASLFKAVHNLLKVTVQIVGRPQILMLVTTRCELGTGAITAPGTSTGTAMEVLPMIRIRFPGMWASVPTGSRH